ncbi:hypothetical protein A5816_000540 [Enterococcus sp. 3G1_DIV0629]|uniref:helix-turn-helix domain-containing protein n=1 Tax=Enterococcus sp. (strain 3G1_DIV0629) TaxID=1834176 RepID=UPI000A337C74|nr:helix-turn-helix transcriptional regulator [Enterococcus sp. 3G1_DIV0629]NTK60265.1 helix-turn-helix transcriptional regulator [Enterococcus faecium]OTO28274.1 hypothetical protein A5816_000540 [Enterococcus sp. 3G1_DIV0629]
MTLYERVSDLAKKQGLSVFDLADKLNLSRNSIYSWKKSSPKAETLQKVADYFDVSTDYLLGRTNVPNQIEDVSDDNMDPLVYYRMDDTDMSPEDMEEVRRQIEFAERLAREQIRNRKGGN